MAKSTDLDEDLDKPIQYDPDFHGPIKSRSCTDVLCLFVFFIFVGAWIGLGLYAITNGDPRILLVPKDSQGARCGLDSHVKDKPYLFFFDLTACFGPNVVFNGCSTPQVCVEECPASLFVASDQINWQELICTYDTTVTSSLTQTQLKSLVEQGKCAQWYLPSTSILNRCIYNIDDRQLNKYNYQLTANRDEVAKVEKTLKTSETTLSQVVQKTVDFFTNSQYMHQKRCVPTAASLQNLTLINNIINGNLTTSVIESAIENIKLLSQAQEVGFKIVEDVSNSWWQILVGLAIAMVICIIYIVLMRWIAAVMVWLSLFGVLALLSFCVYLTNSKYQYYKNNTDSTDESSGIFNKYLSNKNLWLSFLIISSSVLGIIVLILLFLRKRIILAIALIREGSKAVASVTSSLFFPVIPWLLQVGIIVYAIVVALYLSTTGDAIYKVRNLVDCLCAGVDYQNGVACDPDEFREKCSNCLNASCHFTGMDNPEYSPYLHAVNVFGFFWLEFFVSAFGQMVLATIFATWYWTFRKSNLPFFAVTDAACTVLRYHLGTLAFGSLIIAICRMIRVFLEYLDRKLKKYDNAVTRAIMCCLKCFFWCLEKFLKFINKNAYIMCAVHGKNFCSSAKKAFGLLIRNIVRVFVLDKVSDFLFFLSKVLLSAGVGCLAYVFFKFGVSDIYKPELNYELVPVIIIIVCSYFIATIFFNVYSTAVDTLFLCFLEDCERNDGSAEKPYFMSKRLMKILGKKNKFHQS